VTGVQTCALPIFTEASRREIALPDVDHESAGYFPPCSRAHGTFAKTEDGQKILEAGQMVMWEITLAEEMPFAEKEKFIDNSRNFYAALRPDGMLLDSLLAMPTLDQSFKGIKLDASTISDLSLRQAKACGDWLKRRGLDVMVDFAPMLDHYPHISFIRNRQVKIERNRAWEEEILEKAKALGATKALLMHHRNAENHRTVAQAEEDMQLSLRELAALCGSYGMKAIVMNGLPNAVQGTTEDMRRLYPEYACAVNLSHSLLTGEELSEKTLHSAAGVLISTPLKDEIGQVSDAHLPLTGSGYQEKVEAILKKMLLKDCDFVVLDGDYRDYDALYLDRRTVGKYQ